MIKRFASHGSLTGYEIKSWWFALGFFISKCQSLDLVEQYVAGVRFFDLRFAKYKGRWYGARGLMLYRVTLDSAISILRGLSSKEDPIWFRVVSEDTFYKNNDADDLLQHLEDLLVGNDYDAFKPLVVQSKRSWSTIKDFDLSAVGSYDYGYNTPLRKIKSLKETIKALQTSDDKITFGACYSSRSIPYIFAVLVRKFTALHNWKSNDVPVVDFITNKFK